MYTIVDDELCVTQSELDDSEILALLDSGFVSGVLRVNNGVIEYAYIDLDTDTDTVKWTIPDQKLMIEYGVD